MVSPAARLLKDLHEHEGVGLDVGVDGLGAKLHETVHFRREVGVHDEVPVVLDLLGHVDVLGRALPLVWLALDERVLGVRVLLGRGVVLRVDEVVALFLDLEAPREPRNTLLLFVRLAVLVTVLYLVNKLVVDVIRMGRHPVPHVRVVERDVVAQGDVVALVDDEGLRRQI